MKNGTTRRSKAHNDPTQAAPHDRLSYRRNASLVMYWQDGELVFENYALGTKISAEPATCSILHFCGEWRSFREIAQLLSDYDESSILESLNQLNENGVLERSDAEPDSRMRAMKSWASWNPAGGFFHFSTKDTAFPTDPYGAFQELKQRAKSDPMPSPVKAYPRAAKVKLPHVRGEEEFPALLKSRRTWRKYGHEGVPLKGLSQVLELTFGIQEWVKVPGLGRVALKTSPSAGSLHPIEAYVLVQNVKGVRKGIHHYNAARNELEWLRAGIAEPELERSLGSQWWFAKGAFLVLMTAVFGRTRWKYDFPRVYRAILLEAGHLCQTFCLAATWLGLAPFCTMAQTDTKWEQLLGIDGITESIIYVAGAGTRPETTDMRDANILTMGKGAAPKPSKRSRSRP